MKYGKILSMSYEMLVNDEMQALQAGTAAAALSAASLEADQLALAVTSNPAMADGVVGVSCHPRQCRQCRHHLGNHRW